MSKALATEQARTKVGFSSPLQARVAASYKTDYPDVFGDSAASDSGVTIRKFGEGLKSYAAWHDPGDRSGLYVILQTQASQDGNAIATAIGKQLTGDARRLAEEMLMRTRQFVQDFASFIQTFHGEMDAAVAIKKGEAWDLCKAIMGEILRELSLARGSVKYLCEDEPSFYIWGALRAHEVMARFSAHSFHDDPALAGILVRFMLKRRNDIDGNERISQRISTLDGRVTALTTDVKTLKKKPG